MLGSEMQSQVRSRFVEVSKRQKLQFLTELTGYTNALVQSINYFCNLWILIEVEG